MDFKEEFSSDEQEKISNEFKRIKGDETIKLVKPI